MTKVHPLVFVVTAAVLFISLVIVVNYHTVISTQHSSLKNRLSEIEQEIRVIQNKEELSIRDVQKFQARKFGIEEITPGDYIPVP